VTSNSPRRPRFRPDLFEVSLVLALAILVLVIRQSTYAKLPQARNPEIAPFADRYGPANESQNGEEWLIRDFFQDRREGFFVDVGANHYRTFNNTYYLERTLGWSGIAIEPQSTFAAEYGRHRPRTRFRSFFVSDVSDEQAKLYVLENRPLVSSGAKSFTTRAGSDVKAITVPTVTLNDLLTAERVERFDFLNMDIELWEPKALAGFDISRFQPSLVCIEAHPEVAQQILDYFARNGYVLVAEYLRADIHNLYFTPLK
jgi:FkbM family methyltransferase